MSEIQIYINELPCTVDSEKTLPDILAIWGATQPYAIMTNGTFLPHSQHAHYQLKADDKIEVVSAIQGG